MVREAEGSSWKRQNKKNTSLAFPSDKQKLKRDGPD
jgi:hypothetical protein